MKIIVNDGQFKTTVLFIHGYNKTGLDWNMTEHGKPIDIETHIRKSRNTVIVSLDNQDYRRPPDDVAKEIYDSIKHYKKIIGVSHSYGAIFATAICIMYPTLLTTIIMLDPTIKTNEFLNYLKSLSTSETNMYKINHYDLLPNYLAIPNHIIIIIHFNYEQMDKSINQYIVELDKMTRKNVKSRLIVHVIIDDIKNY